MEYQDRVNRPLGMSDVDLLIYDKDIYTMFRTHEGLEPDAFRYDPIVSAGMLASDYAYAQGMQWVNLLTPDSQDKINPGDDLIVPVRTYDNYKQNLPIEKYLTHEVSYTANELNIVRDMGLHNEFVGDFNNYFNQESGLVGGELASPLDAPATTTTTTSSPPRTYLSKPRISVGSIKPYLSPIKDIVEIESRPKYRCVLTPPYYVRDDVRGTLTYEQALTCRPRTSVSPTGPVAVSATTTTPTTIPEAVSGSGTGSGTATGGGQIIDGGAIGGGGIEGAAPETAPNTSTPETKKDATPSTAKVEAKQDYKFIIIGIIVLGAIGYYYAKTQNKDIKTFSVSGAIVGGILGYMYNQHQTKPIDFLSKLGVKSKSESGYFIDDI